MPGRRAGWVGIGGLVRRVGRTDLVGVVQEVGLRVQDAGEWLILKEALKEVYDGVRVYLYPQGNRWSGGSRAARSPPPKGSR